MRVFKFGGASVKDAAAVRNVVSILGMFNKEQLVVVVSAMGKTTNALEAVVHSYVSGDGKWKERLQVVRDYHKEIIDTLGFPKEHAVRTDTERSFVEIEWIAEEAPTRGFNWSYDQIVSQGELLSTTIIHHYLLLQGISNQLLDVRDVLMTDNTYREGKIDWSLSGKLIPEKVSSLFKSSPIVLTQGFIGSTSENFTTTLGREGSDYTAAIFAHCMDAKEMVVWKDVPGILSADPKFYDDAVKLEQLSYRDAIELTYYGATVIHPKTIKPLENKRIPLRVASFMAPEDKGTQVGDFAGTKPLVPCFIFKSDQILFSISSKDFSFIAEENLSGIFALFAKHRVKINMMQNSAISFSICADNDPMKVPSLVDEISKEFKVLYNEHLRLITVRHYYPSTIEQLTKGKTILLEQRSRQTAQVVIKEN
ncbi:MAG: aspartate kinase [Bacteroidota bacterium]